MTDFLDNELHIGDFVCCAMGHGRNSGADLAYGQIIKITDKMIKVRLEKWEYGWVHFKKDGVLISPYKVVRVNEM